MSLNRIWQPSPNYSSRGGATVRLIVIHSSEGATSGASLGNFFANPSSGVSSHTGIDATPNTIWEYVKRDQKSWTAASANPVAVQCELTTPSGASASFSSADWQPYLPNLAQWIKEESAAFGIPMVSLTPDQAQGGGRGVCQHSTLGSWGGGHVDCGPNFPIDQVLQMAGGSSPAPTPPAPTTDWSQENMICTDPVTGGTWVISSREGAVVTVGKAPYCGGTNNTQMNAAKYPCVGIGLRQNNDGYRIILQWSPSDFREYNFPRNGTGKTTGPTY